MSTGRKLRKMGRQMVDALVMDAYPTRKGDRVCAELQVLGGPVTKVYPTLDEANQHGIKIGAYIGVEVSLLEHGSGEISREKDGKTFTDKFPTYRQSVFLPRLEEQAESAKAA